MSDGAASTNTTHLGYLRLALEYFAAAVATHEALAHGREHAGYAPAPAQNLAGQSIELCFKSYLLQHGETEEALTRIGLDLLKGERAAATKGFIHDGDLDQLGVLNAEYGARPFRFRYLRAGMISLLSPGLLFCLNAKIAQATLGATPSGWRFLLQAAGRRLEHDGWLDLPTARGTTGRDEFILANRTRAVENVGKQTGSRRRPNTELIES